jgi:hypothetical protein
LFSPSLIRSLASFLPPSSLFVFWPRSAVQLCHRLCALSSSVIVYFIDFFVSLALGPLDPHASWLLFFLEIFISSSLDFAWSCCALNPRAAARSVFLLAFSHWPIVSCAVLGFQWSVIFSRVRVGSPTAGFDFTHSVLFPTPRRVLSSIPGAQVHPAPFLHREFLSVWMSPLAPPGLLISSFLLLSLQDLTKVTLLPLPTASQKWISSGCYSFLSCEIARKNFSYYGVLCYG